MRTNHYLFKSALLLSILFAQSLPLEAQLMPSSWPKYQCDQRLTGYTPNIGPRQVGLNWNFYNGMFANNGPSLDITQNVYFPGVGHSWCLSPDGSIEWSYAIGDNDTNAVQPLLSDEGKVYFAYSQKSGFGDRNLYALNSDGSLIWSYTHQGASQSWEVIQHINIGSDHTLYVVDNAHPKVYAINSNGTFKWEVLLYSIAQSSCVSIDTDGQIYVGGGSFLHAINPNGTVRWTRQLATITSSISISNDHKLIFGAIDRKVYAFNNSGNEIWSFLTGGAVYSPPSIGPDGTIVAGSQDLNIYCLNSNGTLKWRYPTQGQVNCEGIIDGEGKIYIGSLDDRIYALNSDGTLLWSFVTSGGITGPGSSALSSDGTLYVSGGDGVIYALVTPTPSSTPTETPTPTSTPTPTDTPSPTSTPTINEYGYQAFRITSGDGDHCQPDINDNGDVVFTYKATSNPYSEVFKIVNDTTTPQKVSTLPQYHYNPHIANSGEIVYQAANNIYSTQPRNLPNESINNHASPCISSEADGGVGDILWEEYIDWKVQIYSLNHGWLTSTPGHKLCPNYRDGTSEFVYYQLDNNYYQVFHSIWGKITNFSHHSTHPDINPDGEIVFDSADASGNTQIYSWHNSTVRQVSSRATEHIDPAINASRTIVWSQKDGLYYQIYKAIFHTFTPTPTETPTSTFTETPVPTDTYTSSPTDTPTATATSTPTATPTATIEPTSTPTPSPTPYPGIDMTVLLQGFYSPTYGLQIDTNIVIQFRQGTSPSTATTIVQTYTIKLDQYGQSGPVLLGGLLEGDYFIVLQHYNHLPVISATSFYFAGDSYQVLDFSDSASPFFVTVDGIEQQNVETDGKLTLWGGNGDGNCYVNVLDAFFWINHNGERYDEPGFEPSADYDGNGFVNTLDIYLWLSSNGSTCVVP